jgi:regulator of replication initiation timing
MENRVILDRSRYESMIFELAELTAKAEALQRRLEEWERQTPARKSAEDTDEEQMFQTPAPPNKEFPFDTLVGSSQVGQRHKPLSSLKAVVQEFMKNNTDLAANPDSVRMLQFCLRNYIDLNPELNALPLAEKLEMAGKMAREFLTQVCQRSA